MIFRYLYLVLILFVFISCGAERKKGGKKKTIPSKPFIFNMEHMFSDAEQNASFPIWFNDSIVKKKKIKRIVRNRYPISSGEEMEMPKETRIYNFDEQGGLTSVSIKKFYENMVVEDVIYDYSSVKDEMGYSDVEIRHGEDHREEEGDYAVHIKEKYSDKFLAYSNENTGDYLFYMLNKKNWGALSIDSILNPTPKDLIVLGSTFKPEKMYQVHNTVSESNVVNFNYNNSGEMIESISFENYPFYYKRHVSYDKKGYCVGFIDSTFSANQYLTRSKSMFEMNKEQLPIKVVQEKQGEGGYQVFDYEYYEME